MRARDSKRFRELAYPHLKFLYNLALKYTGRVHEAEDLVQETMYTAFKNFHQLREEEKIRPWLVSIFRNIYLRDAERGARRKEVEFDEGASYLSALEGALSEGPEASFIKKIDAVKLHEIISRLPERYRAPLVLACMEGFSYREVSEALDMPMGTVMSSIFKAKTFIKKELLRLAREGGGAKVLSISRSRDLGRK